MMALLALALLGGVCMGVPPSGHEHVAVPGHGLTRPYVLGGVTIPNWIYGGNAVVTSEHLRLTSDRQSQKGFVWNTQPFFLSEWMVEFEYKVHGAGTRLFGDGFAFWYLSARGYRDLQSRGALTQNTFGGPDLFDGLLVYFDTYRNGNNNHQFPWIGAMHGNGERRYDHDFDGKEHELDGCVHRFRNSNAKERLKIVYTRGTLGLYTSTGEHDKWEECLLVTDIWLPRGGHFGFTSQTGDVADNHDIISFNSFRFNMMDVPDRQRLAVTEASHGMRGEANTQVLTNVEEALERSKNVNQEPKTAQLDEKALKLILKSKHEHKFDPGHKPWRKEERPTVGGVLLTVFKIIGGIVAAVVLVILAYLAYDRVKKSKAQRRFT